MWFIYSSTREPPKSTPMFRSRSSLDWRVTDLARASIRSLGAVRSPSRQESVGSGPDSGSDSENGEPEAFGDEAQTCGRLLVFVFFSPPPLFGEGQIGIRFVCAGSGKVPGALQRWIILSSLSLQFGRRGSGKARSFLSTFCTWAARFVSSRSRKSSDILLRDDFGYVSQALGLSPNRCTSSLILQSGFLVRGQLANRHWQLHSTSSERIAVGFLQSFILRCFCAPYVPYVPRDQVAWI